MTATAPQQPSRARIVLEALPLIVILIAGGYWLMSQDSVTGSLGPTPAPAVPSPDLQPVPAMTTPDLEATFDAYGYQWPPSSPIPRLGIARLPDDLVDLSVPKRKRLFLRSVLPLILAENTLIRRERSMLERLIERRDDLSATARQNLAQLQRRYRVDGNLTSAEVRDQLRQRVDVVPPALALAQAAIETGWGRSRFARTGNNLFGQWTWDSNKGMTPQRRANGANHYVRRFPGLRMSVRVYMRNLNTNDAYSGLRAIREQARHAQERVTGATLARGLQRYSERGTAYVADVREVIRQNRLDTHTRDLYLRGAAP